VAKRVGRLIKAFRRKKPTITQKTSVSKVPASKRPKLKVVSSTEPIRIDRKTFAAKLKASGSNLQKVKL
jgi:hypothetical protein